MSRFETEFVQKLYPTTENFFKSVLCKIQTKYLDL